MENVIGGNMGYIFAHNGQALADNGLTITAIIRDMLKSVLRGVTDFTQYTEYKNNGSLGIRIVNGSWKVATHLKTMAYVQPAAGHHANSQRTKITNGYGILNPMTNEATKILMFTISIRLSGLYM